MIKTFRQFIEENKDEIIALRKIYDQAYKDRSMVIEGLKASYEKLKITSLIQHIPGRGFLFGSVDLEGRDYELLANYRQTNMNVSFMF